VTFAFSKLFFYHDNLKNVAGIDAFKVVHLPAAKRGIFNYNSQTPPVVAYFVLAVDF